MSSVLALSLAAMAMLLGGCPDDSATERQRPVFTPVRGIAVSPAGSHAAVTTSLGTEGSNLVVILKLPECSQVATVSGLYPSWAADGSTLYYTSNRKLSGSYIRSFDLRTRAGEVVPWLPETTINVVSSPSEAEMVALRPGQPESVLWLCAPAKDECRRLFAAERIVQPSITWSGDGDHLFLLHRGPRLQFPEAELTSIQVDSGRTRFLEGGAVTFPLVPTPDGQLYYARFADRRGDARNLLRMDLSTGRRQVLPLPEQADSLRDFTVSPGATHMLMRDDGNALWLLDIEGNHWRQVAERGWGAFWLPTAPDEFRFFHATEGSDELLVRGGSTGSPEVFDVTALTPDAGRVMGR